MTLRLKGEGLTVFVMKVHEHKFENTDKGKG